MITELAIKVANVICLKTKKFLNVGGYFRNLSSCPENTSKMHRNMKSREA